MHVPRQPESMAGGLALILFLYCGLATSLGFGLYELLQPTRVGNPGLSIYKPPPRTAIAVSNFSREQCPHEPCRSSSDKIAGSERSGAPASSATGRPETTGQSIREVQIDSTALPLVNGAASMSQVKE